MDKTESQGFWAMVGYEARLTLAEGVTLGAGAAVAIAAAHLASRSLAETEEEQEVTKIAKSLYENPEFLAVMRAHDGAFEYMSKGSAIKRIRAIARFMKNTGTSIGWVQKLLRAGGIEHMLSSIERPLPEQLQLVELAERPFEQVEWALSNSRRFPSRSKFIAEFMETSPEDFQTLRGLFSASPYNDYPGILEILVDLARAGFSSKDVERMRQIPVSPFINWNRPEVQAAMRRVLERYDDDEIQSIAPFIRTSSDILDFEALGLEKLPRRRYRIEPSGFQWKEYAEKVRLFHEIPFELFERAAIMPDDYLGIYRAFKKSDDIKSAVYALAAATEAVPSHTLRKSVSYLATRLGTGITDPELVQLNLKRINGLAKLLKSGLLQKFDKTMNDHSEGGIYYEDKFFDLVESADVIKDWTSYGDLSEQLAVAVGLMNPGQEKPIEELSDEQKTLRRKRDRLAAKDPEWAIEEFPAEYKRGQRIAKFLGQITRRIEEMLARGETVVIHGRDGELLYDLLMRKPGIDRSRVKYAITSRPMTTMASEIPASYRDYLGRLVPKGAVHIDTGFEGSIPRWFDKEGFGVKQIQMVSATRPEEEIEVDLPLSKQEKREIVLSDLEHSSQRLENPIQYRSSVDRGGFKTLVYSWAAPGYHARKYGVLDALGMPRLAAKTPKTRFEEKMKLRIAAEPEEEIEPEVAGASSFGVK